MERNNIPVHVNFPKKLQVYSPEIDSIKATSNRISNWLHNDLKNIIEPLTVVRFIPDLIKELKQVIVNQFTNLLLGQVEGDVINRQANIKVLNKKIESTQTLIAQKEENMDKTTERVTERYEKLSEQLNIEHETFLRKLDSHAYEIIDEIYPKQIQEKFSYDSLPGIDFLAEHAMVSVVERNISLAKGFEDAKTNVTVFLDNRKQFYADLSEFECRSLEEGYYEIPWVFVEMYNNNTGESKLECWFEKELEKGEKDHNLDELREEIELKAESEKLPKDKIDKLVSDLNSFLIDEIPEIERKRFVNDIQYH